VKSSHDMSVLHDELQGAYNRIIHTDLNLIEITTVTTSPPMREEETTSVVGS
jgi:hypothetical protein